jgi:acetyl-CoA/propionyl-CoA carboxylase biotin carboxyl carrier protein
LRTRLGAAACAAAASVDYRGAGTVEFLVSHERPDEFFFIEMNTRLQVEHPVTELVTGIDLVEQQLRIASGLPLPLAQSDVRLRGHAIEARVYAEDPARGFLPSTGRILAWRAAPGVRTDSGVETGTTVPGDYDPMLAKVIAFAPDRPSAIDRLARALGETVVLGVDTNLGFLGDLLHDPRVRRGDLHTALIDGLPTFSPPEPTEGMLAAAASVTRRAPSGTHASPLWARGDGWRLGGVLAPRRVTFDIAGRLVDVPNGTAASASATLARDGSGAVWVHDSGRTVRLVPVGRRERTLRALPAASSAQAVPALVAPLPGTVVAVHVADGARVRAGERIVTIEAMKMEHTLVAPADGLVHVTVGVSASVARDERLAVVTPGDARSEEEPHEE